MTTKDAIREVISQGYRKRSSETSLKRAYRALRFLGITAGSGMFDMLAGLEYWDRKLLATIPELLPLIIDEDHRVALFEEQYYAELEARR